MARIAAQVRAGIADIQPYLPGLTDDEIKKMYGLRKVVKLNANENALGPSPLALAAIAKEFATIHFYPDGSSEQLRNAIASFHGVSTDQVFVGNGSDDIIKLISEAFLDDADEVVMPHPSFSQYAFGAAIMRAKVRQVPLRPDFTYDVEALLAAVSPRTKLMYLCSPNNPTGTVLRQDQLDWLVDRLPEHVVLILDFAYNDFSENPTRAVETQALLEDPRIAVMHTFSKLYGLAGLRIGYALGSRDMWSFVNRVREPFNVNRIAQRAAAAALEDESHRVRSRALVAESYPIYAELQSHGYEVVPSEANFVLVRTGDAAFTVRQLMAQGIMVRGGFRDLDQYVRISYGLEEDNRECVAALLRLRS